MRYTHPALDTLLVDARRIFETNFFSLLEVIKSFVPLLLRSKSPALVNEGSIASETYVPYQGKLTFFEHII